MGFFRRSSLGTLLLIILPLVLTSGQRAGMPIGSYLQLPGPMGSAVRTGLRQDPLVTLLGASFDQIGQVLGEPDEQGYDEWRGPHYYILFQSENGTIRFCSPAPMQDTVAVSIIVQPYQEVLGVKVGMPFTEIRAILGVPDFGPELGLDNRYYMDYFFGETKDGMPEILVSFSAASSDHPTDLAFIKWEAFEYGPMGVTADGGQSTASHTTPRSLMDHAQLSQP